jgi:fucose 4-O-acetylase-like acetyltransferase
VSSGRLAGLDICRGLTIVGVVLHHVTGAALSYITAGGQLYWAVLVLNRLTQFVVPTFLFVTALVFALSAPRWSGWRRYTSSRLRQLLWPYLLWTALYFGFKALIGVAEPTTNWLSRYLVVGLLMGKGYFHLYYLLLALQVAALLPLLRRWSWASWPLPWVVLGACAAQLGIYVLNASVLQLRNVGSSVLWYVLPVVLGLALGATPGRFEAFWRRSRPLVWGLALLATLWYLPLGIAEVRGTLRTALNYSLGNWAFTALAAVVVAGLGLDLARRRAWPGLEKLGQASLQIYLLHPALLWGLDRLGFPGTAALFPPVMALYTALGIGLPWALATAVQGKRLSVWLFGR